MQKALKYIREHQREMRRGLAACLACVVAFGTVCASALPALTLENEAQELICGLDEHQHGSDCYGTGELVCTVPEGEGGHVHGEGCYDENDALTCPLEESAGHQHGPECYGAGALICGLEEHAHTEACYRQEQPAAEVPQEEPAGEDPQVEEAAARIAALPTLAEMEETLAAFEGTGDGYGAYLAEITAQARAAYEAYAALTKAQQEQVTNVDKLMALEQLWSTAPLEGEPEEDAAVSSFYLWLHVRDINGGSKGVYSNPEWVAGSGFNGPGIDDALSCTEDGSTYYLIPVRYFEANYSNCGFQFDPTVSCPFVYAPNANQPAANLTAASYVQVDGDWYVMVQDTGSYNDGESPRSNIYYTTYNTQAVRAFRFWLKIKKNSADVYTTVAAYDSQNTDSPENDVTTALQVRTVSGAPTDSYLVPIRYFEENYSAYGFRFDPAVPCPFVYAPNASRPTGNLTAASYVQVNGDWYVMVRDTGNYGAPPRSNIYYTTRASEITDAVSPSSTVINLFDYWTTTRNEVDVKEEHYDEGINAGHALKFKSMGLGTKGSNANVWTGTNDPYTGIVQNTLVGGYPVLTDDEMFGMSDGTIASGGEESLAYLFDPTFPNNGCRAAYRNVKGLLQLDDDGYYYYDSKQNYAEFDEDNNRFILYDDWAVTYYNDQSKHTTEGQFFPFNPYDQAVSLDGSDPELNHYLGMTLTARFVQHHDGYITSAKKTPMVFEFSGDDDVWIFIDDVLVADLGGIHDETSVEINFATGKIIVNGNEKTAATLLEMFQKAHAADTEEWKDGTFANGTYHTLKFFYLERGSWASDLKLMYNLSEIPETSIDKVDQYGNSVEGARFAIYAADQAYNILQQAGGSKAALSGEYTYDAKGNIVGLGNDILANALFTGTTDKSGKIVFLDENDMPYSIRDLRDMFGEHFVLKEIAPPPGYRLVSDEIHLRVENNVLLCDDGFGSGAWASASLLVYAPTELMLANSSALPGAGSSAVPYYDPETGKVEGSVFAVVLKYVGQRDAEGNAAGLYDEKNWRPVYGTSQTGFQLVDTTQQSFVQAAIDTAQRYGESQNVFELSPYNQMMAQIQGMPGDISTYYYMLDREHKGRTQYTVAYYYTTETIIGENGHKDWSRVNDGNTYLINADELDFSFERVFGSAIQVPNLVNRLIVQKLDEKRELVNGAAFAMYQVEQEPADGAVYYVAGDRTRISLEKDDDGDNQGTASLAGGSAAGRYRIDGGTGEITVEIDSKTYTVRPVDKQITTTREANGVNEDGSASFFNLDSGCYYLREIAAPSGYRLNTAEVMVRVDETAVYANAGTAEDGVTVGRGPGYMVATLDMFASAGQIDNTLTWLYEQLLVSPESTRFADVYTALDPDGGWMYLKENYAAGKNGLTAERSDALTSYLVYARDGDNVLYNYALNSSRSAAGAFTNMGDTRRLYTDVGWSYYLLYQDYAYGSQHLSDGAAYADLRGQEISNLFSRSVYVRITDEPDEDDEHPGTVVRRVVKVWNDGGGEDSRPDSVVVQLLQGNGTVADEVTLNATNSWTYEWTDLDADEDWQVVEKNVPEGYTVSVSRDGTTFTVTNTLAPPPPPDHPDEPDDPDDPPDDPDDPDDPDEPDTPDHPDEPDEPDTPDEPDKPDEPDEPDIPQTGQLWWPVPLLACGGMRLFLTGWLKRRNGDCGGTDE